MSDGEDLSLGTIGIGIVSDDTQLESGLRQSVQKAAKKGDEAAQAYTGSFGRSLVGSSGAIDIGRNFGSQFNLGFATRTAGALAAIGIAVRGAERAYQIGMMASGLGIAAQYSRAETVLGRVTGSPEEAALLGNQMRNLNPLGFDPSDVMQVDRSLLGIGRTAQQTRREVGALADTIAAVGGGSQDLAQVGRAMTMLRLRPHAEMDDIGALARAGIDIDKVYSAGTGRQIAPGMGGRYLIGLPGMRAYDILTTGMEKVYGGSAEQVALSTPQGIERAIQVKLQNVMEPTGKALLPGLENIGKATIIATDAAGKFNAFFGGGPGLTGVLIVGGIATRKLIGDFTGAIGSLGRMSAAVETLAGASENAATRLDYSKIAGGGTGPVGRFFNSPMMNQGEGIAMWLTNQTDADKMRQSWIYQHTVGFATEPLFNWASKLSVNADRTHDSSNAAERTAKATEASAAALQRISYTSIGGGERVRSALSGLGYEHAIQRAMQTGVA